VTSSVVETIEGIDLDHTPPCDAQINGLRCPADSSYRITFFCCGTRSVFLCKQCFLIVQVHPAPGCLYCDQRVTDWRLA
jgi:hypothetical protein